MVYICYRIDWWISLISFAKSFFFKWQEAWIYKAKFISSVQQFTMKSDFTKWKFEGRQILNVSHFFYFEFLSQFHFHVHLYIAFIMQIQFTFFFCFQGIERQAREIFQYKNRSVLVFFFYKKGGGEQLLNFDSKVTEYLWCTDILWWTDIYDAPSIIDKLFYRKKEDICLEWIFKSLSITSKKSEFFIINQFRIGM